MLPTTMRMEADFYPLLPCFAHMIFGKHQRHIRLEGRMTPDQSMAADFLGQPRHAEGFLGRYTFSGIPWYAGRFQRYCFF